MSAKPFRRHVKNALGGRYTCTVATLVAAYIYLFYQLSRVIHVQCMRGPFKRTGYTVWFEQYFIGAVKYMHNMSLVLSPVDNVSKLKFL